LGVKNAKEILIQPSVPATTSSVPKQAVSKPSLARWIVAAALCLLGAAYIAALITGRIPKDQKVDSTALIILGAAGVAAFLLVSPGALENLKRIKIAGFEFEMEQLKKKQFQQQEQLELLHLVLSMVLRPEEAKHLLNLKQYTTSGYKGGHALRTELRSLCAVRLLERQPGRQIRDIKDGMSFDLTNYVNLTAAGSSMANQLEKLESEKIDAAA
jgi:hypothetical protein